MFRTLLLISLSLGLVLGANSPARCAEKFSESAEIKTQAKSELATKSVAKYPVFFITDRLIKHTDKGDDFTDERSSDLAYGDFKPNAVVKDKIDHVDHSDIAMFQSKKQFTDALNATGADKVAVFVHGYRKSFDGSLLFAQQIASELDMPVVMFAWPSRNKYSAYMIDECTAEWSSYQFAGVLKDLGNQFGNENVNILSHSLGARIVSWSLRILETQHELNRPFACNLFFSPDVDRDTFLAESFFLKQCSGRVKVYLDSHDTRIWLSKVLHGSPRIGTMDNSSVNEMLTSIFQFDTSMPSHHIPYPLLSAAMHNPISNGPLIGN